MYLLMHKLDSNKVVSRHFAWGQKERRILEGWSLEKPAPKKRKKKVNKDADTKG